MHERCEPRRDGPEITTDPNAQGAVNPEGNSRTIEEGNERSAFGGVFGRGAHEEDDPGTWETLTLHAKKAGTRGADDPSSSTTNARERGSVVAKPKGNAKNKRSPRGRSKARENRSRDRWSKGVGGPHTSDEVG